MPGPRGNHPKETNAPPRAKNPLSPQRDSLEQPPPSRLPERNPPMPPPKEGPTTVTSEAAPTEQSHGIEDRPQEGLEDNHYNLSPQQTTPAAPPHPSAHHPSNNSDHLRTRPSQNSHNRTGEPCLRPAPPSDETSRTTPHKSDWTTVPPLLVEPTQIPPPPPTRDTPSQLKTFGRTVSLPPRMAKRSDGRIIGPTRPAPPSPEMSTLPLRSLASDNQCPSTKSERESTSLTRHSAPSNRTSKNSTHSFTPHNLILPPPHLWIIYVPYSKTHGSTSPFPPWPGLTLPTIANPH